MQQRTIMRDFPQSDSWSGSAALLFNILPHEGVNMANESPLDLDAVLAGLIAQRDRLNTAIDALQAVHSGSSPITGAGSMQAASATVSGSGYVIRPDEFFGMTVLEGAKKYLGMTKRPQNARSVTEALQIGGYLFSSGNPVTTVASVLNRGLDGGGIVRTGKGMFGLVEWYPGSGRARKPRQNGESETQELPTAIKELL